VETLAAWSEAHPRRAARLAGGAAAARTLVPGVGDLDNRGCRGDRFDGPVVSLYRVREGKLARAQMFYFDTPALMNFLGRATGTYTYR
jgi:ketosteroid isomerase-like protein